MSYFLAAPVLAVLLPGGDPVAIGGTSFVDRGASGEVDLGTGEGGLAVLDADGDGWPDLLVGDAAGAPARLFQNVADPQGPGGRGFVDATAGSGLDDADGTSRAAGGIVVADVDGDGHRDVYMTGYRASDGTSGLFYRGLGGGAFANASVAAGVRVSGYEPVSASFADYDLDGDCDLLVACWEGGAGNLLLWRNEGDGTFRDASALLPVVTEFRVPYAQAWTDVDGDGWDDALVLVTDGPSVLLRNVSDGAGGRRFENAAAALGFTSLGPAPMGIATGDPDGDGDLDVWLSNATVGAYYRAEGGVLVQHAPLTAIFGWGVAFADVDLDRDQDFFLVGSWGAGGGNAAALDRLWRNDGGGTWTDVSPALNGISAPTRYAVQTDVDADGLPDFVTVAPAGAGTLVSLYHNVSAVSGHWSRVVLEGDGGAVNRSAVGALVRLEAGGAIQARLAQSGSSTTSTEDPRLHFGLGAAEAVERVEVRWPRTGDVAARTEVFEGPFPAGADLVLRPGDGGPGTALCFGDGSGAACPCGNASPAPGRGCVHSGGVGMRIGGAGAASVSADDLVLVATDAPPHNSGLFYAGDAALAPAAPLYDGLQCAGGDVRRFRPLFQTSGVFRDAGFAAQDPSGVFFVPGGTRVFQLWCRDAAAPASPCGARANLSPGWVVTLAP